MRRGQGCAGEVHRQRWVRTRCTHTHVYVSGTRETKAVPCGVATVLHARAPRSHPSPCRGWGMCSPPLVASPPPARRRSLSHRVATHWLSHCAITAAVTP